MTGVKAGPDGKCQLVEMPLPTIKKDEDVLVRVFASAINRADTLQRRGLYPAPPGESDVLGLEMAGKVVVAGRNNGSSLSVDATGATVNAATSQWAPGDRVMALLAGGGNGEFAVVPSTQLLPIPPRFSFKEAAAIPETWLTAFQLLHFVGKAKAGETVIIHAAASGVGTAALQQALGAGLNVVAVAGSDDKLRVIEKLAEETLHKLKTAHPDRSLGRLLRTVNYKASPEWAKTVLAPAGIKADLVLDPVGGSFWRNNIEALQMDGRWVLFGTMGGGTVEGGLLAQLLRKRVTLVGTTLRNRSAQYKGELTQRFREQVLPLLAEGVFSPIIDREFDLAEIQAAHDRMESDANIGKIVIRVANE